VIKQIKERKDVREKMISQQMEEYKKYQATMNKLQPFMNPQTNNDQTSIINQLTLENRFLTDKVQYLEDKIKKLIQEKIQEKMKDKQQSEKSEQSEQSEQQTPQNNETTL